MKTIVVIFFFFFVITDGIVKILENFKKGELQLLSDILDHFLLFEIDIGTYNEEGIHEKGRRGMGRKRSKVFAENSLAFLDL